MIIDPRIEKIIDQLDLLQVFDEFRVDYILEGKNIGIGFIGINPCPFCGDNRNHWAVNINKKFGTCFKCKGGMGTIRLISYYGKMSFEEVQEYLLDKLDNELDIVQQVTEIIRSKKEEEIYKPPKKDKLPENNPITYKLIESIPQLKNFFKKRKLYYWNVKYYDIRWNLEKKGQVIFPIYYRNKIVSYQTRSILYKRYNNADSVGEYLYNEDKIIKGKPLILVEGFLDYTRIDSYIRIYLKDKISVTTGLVKMVSKKQLKRIINCNPPRIIVMFDADSWFNYDRIKSEVPMDVDFIILPKGKDPNDLKWREIHEIFRKNIYIYL